MSLSNLLNRLNKIKFLLMLLAPLFFLLSCIGQSPLSPDQAAESVNKQPVVITNYPPTITPTQRIMVFKNGGLQRLPRLNQGTDSDGDILYYTVLTSPKKGKLSNCLGMNSSSTIDLDCFYLPNPDVVGTAADSFTYGALDRNGGQSNVVVTFDIVSNSAPVPVNKTVSVSENGVIATVQSLGMISPATDIDGDPMTYVMASFPQKGALSNCIGLNGSAVDDLTCDYTPMGGLYGSDSFTYAVSDNHGGVGTGSVIINIQSTNQNPTVSVNPFTASVVVNKTSQSVDMSSLVISDADVGDILSYTLTTAPTRGSLYGCLGLSGSTNPPPDLTCTYTPNTGIEGTAADSFYFTVSDNSGGSVVGQVKVNLNVSNLTPAAQSTSFAIVEDTTSTISFTLNDQGEGDLASIKGTSPLNGLLVFDGILPKGSLKNCMGLNGTSQVPTSTVSCSYVPSTNATGSDSFSYQVTDLGGKTATGTITLVIDGVNDAPTLSSQSFSVYQSNGPQSITIAPPSDPDDGSTFTYVKGSGPSSGTLTNCMSLNGTSSSDAICDFDPGSFSGVSTFSVTATDNGGLTSTATMSVNSSLTSLAPYFSVRSATSTAPITELMTTSSPAMAVNLGNFNIASYPSTSTVTHTLVDSLSASGNGTLSLCPTVGASTFSCSYTPPVNRCGSPLYFFDVKATDQYLRNDSFRIFVNVGCLNSVPTFSTSSLTFTVDENTLTHDLPAISPASDIDGGSVATNDPLSYSVSSLPTKGVLSDCLGIGFASSTDLTCKYKIYSNYVGIGNCIVTNPTFDSFTIMASDGRGGTATQIVNIEVIPFNTDPIISTIADRITTRDSGIYAIPVTVDEGTGTDEDCDQSLKIQVFSSDQAVFNDARIKVFYGANRTTAFTNLRGVGSSVSYLDVGDGTSDAGGNNRVYIDLVPEPLSTSSASATITVNVKESTPSTASVVSRNFKATVLNIVTDHLGWTSATAVGSKVDKADTIFSEGSLGFSWNTFTLSSTAFTPVPSVIGYFIYRSASGGTSSDFDFGNPLSSTPIDVNVPSYIDTTLGPLNFTSTSAAAYWYRVRPVLSNGAIMDTSTHAYTSLRMLVPPKNKALVHRWMANLDTCKKMGKVDDGVQSNIDRENNYRCKYQGPGNTDVSGVGYWDLGTDLLMDRFEVGCKITDSPSCAGGTCIGNSTPSATSTINDFYYDRSSGTCYVNTTGAAIWKSIKELTAESGHSSTMHVTADLGGFANSLSDLANQPYLPPLTGITQLEAYNYCSSTSFGINVSTGSGVLTGSPFQGRTPSRKEQVVAASWGSTLSDSTINTLEIGSNLTNSGGCNSSNGGGLTFADTLSSFSTDVYPRTLASGVKIVRTGSFATGPCTSRYGIQDLVGNVEEWASDHFSCQTSSVCNGVHQTSTAPYNSYFLNNNDVRIQPNPTTSIYHFDGATSNTGPGGAALTEWILDTASLSATKFFLPMGLPAVTAYTQTADNGVLTINGSIPTISTAQLHGDKIRLNAANLLSASMVVQFLAGVTSGGAYNWSGAPAGVYALQLVDSFTSTSPNIGFRCVTPIPNP